MIYPINSFILCDTIAEIAEISIFHNSPLIYCKENKLWYARNDGAWTSSPTLMQADWENVANKPEMSGNAPVSWDTIPNKPADFPPSTHNHDAAYSASNHTHSYEPANANIQSHIGSTANPHTVTKAQVGLANVDNTSDATIKACIPNASYRSLLDCTASHIAGRVAGNYWLGQGQAAGITGVGTLYAPNLLYIDSADYPTVDGKAPQLRLRVQVYCNDVAPTGVYTFGLRPVTRPATAGGAGLNIYTLGAAVAGSTVVVTTPVADSMNILVGSDFTLPANGHYVLGFTSTTNVAVSSHLHISALLQMRNN